MTILNEALGHPPQARLLMIAAAKLGQAHGANLAVYEALRTGLATTANLMLPCPWARDAASRYRGEDIGVSLTLNCELENYRWGPVTMAPSLIDGDGGFPRTLDDLWNHADLDEVRRECRAQIERAILWGFDVSHLDSHLGVLQQRPEFFDIFLELAVDFGLPVCLPPLDKEAAIGFPVRTLAAAEGVLFPDHVVALNGRPSRQVLEQVLFDLPSGVTEITLQPALDAPEIRGLDPLWSRRVEDYLVTTHDAAIRAMVERADLVLVGYNELRAAMVDQKSR